MPLHIVGERDGAVPPEAGEHLASRFKDPVIVRTSAGHWLPRDDPEVAAALRAFLAAAPARPRAAAAEAAPRRRRRKKKDG
ncbi:transcription factor Iwr1 [Aureococcus anophagefferens]|nr:transcription factor Iwr1 [Aureococcus anophagefferens]